MDKTSEEQIEYARAMMNLLLQSCPLLKCVHVDDWDDYGSFRAFARLKGRWTGRRGGAFSYFIPEGEDLQTARNKQSRSAVRNGSIMIRKLYRRLGDDVSECRSTSPGLRKHKTMGYAQVDGYDDDAFTMDFRVQAGADRTKVGLP